MRGALDAEGGMGYLQLRAYYYDSSGAYLSYQTAATRTDDTLTTTWEEGGGQVTTPANAASVRIYLYNFSSSGWAALDNVRLSRPNGATIQRSTYGLAGQMVATRVSGDPVGGNNGLFYFYGDHLGSSRLLVTGSNGVVAGSRTWYLPFGGYRGTSPTQAISDRDFTGQKENRELGLLYYNARYYVPGIGRFASADTIIPNPANPQSFNRYSYVRNNPVNLADPTGHRECGAHDNCSGEALPPLPPPTSPATLPTQLPDGVELTPEALEAWNNLQALQNIEGAWWGETLDAQEAVAIFLNREFNSQQYYDVGEETMLLRAGAGEAVTRKYNQNCSAGVWSAQCLNGFWAYAQPIREMHKGGNLGVTLQRNLYDWGQWGDGFMTLAHSVMNSPGVEGKRSDRPYDWYTLRLSEEPITIARYWNNILMYGTGVGENHLVYACYDCSSTAITSIIPPSSLFVVMTGDQYTDLSDAP